MFGWIWITIIIHKISSNTSLPPESLTKQKSNTNPHELTQPQHIPPLSTPPHPPQLNTITPKPKGKSVNSPQKPTHLRS